MNVLALNAGSNSLKFEVVTVEPGGGAADFGRSMLSGSYENIGKPDSAFALWEGKRISHSEPMEIPDHGRATELLFKWLQERDAGEIQRIGHRVVHGAHLFHEPVKITGEVVKQIESLEDLAPLHNASALKVIRAAQAQTEQGLEMVAVFDTVFHRNIPEQAALYALPQEVADHHKIRRYGFHGISHKYMSLRYAQIAGKLPNELKLITLHLEGGSSAAAIREGVSVDTSMGFTPLEGLIMGTRCGDIDPAIVTYLMKKEGLDIEGIEKLLNKESGLLGISGTSADSRELRKDPGNKRNQLALDMFGYRVRKYVGAYLAVLGGADAIIFGGGIGENTPEVREHVCEDLGWCGGVLDRERNDKTIDCEGAICAPESRLQLWVIPTQEGLMIAKETADCG